MNYSNYSPNEIKELIKDIINANDILIEKGEIPISLSIEGEPGIGKTTVIRETVNELNRPLYKLNLAQLTEPSELIGYYAKEFKLKKENSEVWVTENMIPEMINSGYTYSSEIRTKPCPPDWVNSLQENSILLLDDYSRSNQLFSQACMELINEQSMIGWNLKDKKIQIILSENPDDGEYNVQSFDAAQTSRMLKARMVWDYKDWAERAEKLKFDQRIINFVLSIPEKFENKKKDGVSNSNVVQPRMLDKFFAIISTIKDWEKNLSKVIQIGDLSIGKDVTSLLVNFINKKLDKLPLIEDLIFNYTLEKANESLLDCAGSYKKENHKTAVSAILCTRIFNYVKVHNKEFKKDNIKQLGELILSDSFTSDQKFIMVKNCINYSSLFTQILGSDVRIINYITK